MFRPFSLISLISFGFLLDPFSKVEAQFYPPTTIPSLPAPPPQPSQPAPKVNPPKPPPPPPKKINPPKPPSNPPPQQLFANPSISEYPARPYHEEAQDILELIENQLNAIQNKDFNRAYFLYTSNIFRGQTTFDDFKYFMEHYPIFTHNKNALFGNPDFRRTNTVITGTLTALDGSAYKAEYHLVKEGNQWKIAGIKLYPLAPRKEAPKATPAGANYDFQSDIH